MALRVRGRANHLAVRGTDHRNRRTVDRAACRVDNTAADLAARILLCEKRPARNRQQGNHQEAHEHTKTREKSAVLHESSLTR
jgi:hypothetical protein